MSEPRPPGLPDARDAWLHQALRHAPDAAAAPPIALREAILAEARSAAHLRSGRTAESGFLARATAFWSWLARPPVAAGFASIMAATLVGLMWWDRPMDETLRPAPVASSRVVESTPALPAAQLAPVPANVPVLPPPAQVTQSAAAPPSADAASSRRAVVTPAKTTPAAVDAAKARSDEPTSIPPPSAPPASPFPGNDSGKSGAPAGSLGDEPRQATPAVARKTEKETPNEAQGSGSVAALAKPASPGRGRATPARRDTAATGTADTADALGAGAAAAPQAFAAAPPAATAPLPAPDRDNLNAAAKTVARPMAALLASIAQGAARWALHATSGARPLDPSARAWLADVDTATAGRWQSTAGRDTRAEPPAQAPAFAVLLDLDGHAAAIVRVEDGGVFFQESSGAAWFAPLPADAIARLRAALPR